MNIQGGAAFRLNTSAEVVSDAGLAPLVLCLLGVALLPDFAARELAQRIAIAYGAVVLAFVGAVHWGLALAGILAWSPVRIVGSILPAATGTAATVLGGQHGLALLAVSFGIFWLYEHRKVGPELPAPYLSLRRNLSLVACLLFAVTLIISDKVGLV
jgi:hypothetical protein